MERKNGFRKFGHLPCFKLINTPMEIAAHILNELNFLNEKKTQHDTDSETLLTTSAGVSGYRYHNKRQET